MATQGQARIIRLARQGGLAFCLAGLLGCNGGAPTASPAMQAAASDAAAAGGAPGGDIVIGVGVPLSGGYAAEGMDVVTGVKLAAADLNQHGGLLGRRLRVVTADDGCGIASAETAATQLVAADISLAVGHFCSVSTHTAAGVYAARNIVEITPASTATAVTEFAKLRHWTTLFRTVNNDSESGRFAAAYFARKYPGQAIGFLHGNDQYSVTIAQSFRTGMQSHGETTVVDLGLLAGGATIDAQISALQQARVAAIFVAGDAATSGAVVRGIRQAGISADIYGTSDMADARFGAAAGNAADGVRFSDTRISVDTAVAPGLAAAYAGEGANGHGYVPAAYAAVQAWAAGVARAKTLSGTEVAAAMRQAPVDTAIGRLSWDAKGDLDTSLYGWYIWRGNSYQVDTAQ